MLFKNNTIYLTLKIVHKYISVEIKCYAVLSTRMSTFCPSAPELNHTFSSQSSAIDAPNIQRLGCCHVSVRFCYGAAHIR